MATAFVNKIIPFSAVDGPGNRTAVFLQGCNFNCKYCHNPETREVCTHCGACVPGCPTGAISLKDGRVYYTPKLCCGCDACIHTCTKGSSPKVQMMSAGEVYTAVIRQKPYIRGVTVSGGECTTYPGFLRELFALCKEAGLTTLLDSNGGLLDFSQEEELLEVTDGVMLDVKAFSEEEHMRVTDCGNELVLKNAVTLAERGKLYEVRTVVVPGLYDAEETVRRTAELLTPYLIYGEIRYKLISYRPNGVREEFAHFPVPAREEMEHLADVARTCGLKECIII